MKYLKQTLRYLFIESKGKHFLILLFISLVPAAAIAVCMPAERFIANVVDAPAYKNWAEAFCAYFRGDIVSGVCIPLGIILSIVTTSVIISIIIGNFRIGTFSLPSVLRATNDNFFPSVLFIGSTVLNWTVFFILYTLLSFMWYYIAIRVVFIVFSAITMAILVIIMLYIESSFTLWLPIMAIKGLRGKSAFTTAVYQSRGKQKYFLPGHLFSCLITVVTVILAYFLAKVWYVSFVISALGYAFSSLFGIVFSIIAYFGENYLPREDLNRSPYKRRF